MFQRRQPNNIAPCLSPNLQMPQSPIIRSSSFQRNVPNLGFNQSVPNEPSNFGSHFSISVVISRNSQQANEISPFPIDLNKNSEIKPTAPLNDEAPPKYSDL